MRNVIKPEILSLSSIISKIELTIAVLQLYNADVRLLLLYNQIQKGDCMRWNEQVLDLMKQKGINQKQLATLSGITESSICRYLKSEKTPRMDIVVNVAKALQVETDYFLSEEDRGQTAFNVISAAIARKGNELSPDERNRLIALIAGGGKNA